MITPAPGSLSFNLLKPGKTRRSVRTGWRGYDYLYFLGDEEDTVATYTRLYNFWMDLDSYVHKSMVITLFTVPPMYVPSSISPYLDVKDWMGKYNKFFFI